jgi:DNA invertase Pin-like site-specific DNA recombinase
MGKMFFNIAEFEADLIRMRTREGMAVARAKGKFARQTTEALRQAAN